MSTHSSNHDSESTKPEVVEIRTLGEETPADPDAPPNPPLSPRRHPDLWLDDGSVVLQVSNTIFRVHRTILCMQSEIFKDLFTIPPSNDAEEQFEGCPLIQLPDDEGDVTSSLRAIYDPCYFKVLRAKVPDEMGVIDEVSGILRMSEKYRFRALKARCITVLEVIIPLSLDGLITRCNDSSLDETRFEVALSVAATSLTCRIPMLLPGAFYQICQALGEDGSLDDLLLESSAIGGEYKARCLSGRSKLFHAQRGGGAFLTVTKDHSCRIYRAGKFGDCSGRATYNTPPSTGGKLEIFKKLESATSTTQASCHHCGKVFEEAIYRRQNEIWDTLPITFGLGKSWEELRRTQEEQ